MNKEEKIKTIIKGIDNFFGKKITSDEKTKLSEEIVSLLAIEEMKEIVKFDFDDNTLSEFQIEISKMHLAKTKAVLDLIEADDSNISIKIYGLKTYTPYVDAIKSILEHQVKELEKAINGEKSDFWD